MAKFGDIINREFPVLICFYKDEISSEHSEILNDVALILKGRANIIRINISKNKLLAETLDITETPVFSIYKNGELKSHQKDGISAIELIKLVQQFI